ncbi:MAG: hypothetical protein QOG85_2608 [Gaiellaceae bacterium]|jgi:hypothetical protein|nr:hypothetical protein [Gaiellaceae bacterium]
MKKLALVLVVAPLALVACGGGASSTAPKLDPVAYVKHAASKTASMASEHMTVSGNVSVGLMGVKMNGSGDFSNTNKTGQMSVAMTLMGQDVRMNEILTGTTIYMSSPLFSAELPAGKTWMKLDLEKLGQSHGIDYSSLMSQSPTQTLQRLGAAGSVKSVGTETIDGVETTHYQVTNLDISKLPQGSKIESLGLHPKYGPIDVWIGTADGYVHRESMSFTYSMNGQSASMDMTINLSKFGEAVNVKIPPASKTVDGTSLAGGGLGA